MLSAAVVIGALRVKVIEPYDFNIETLQPSIKSHQKHVELWFLFSIYGLRIPHICASFMKISSSVLKLYSRPSFHINNVTGA